MMVVRERHHQRKGETDAPRSHFHGRSEEIVKGAAIGAVLLLWQCPLSIAKKYALRTY
jgi:hypothetical protein